MTLAPLVVSCAFQAWLMLCPLPKVQVTVQPVMAEAPATTRFAPQQATFGLFGVYVRSLPSVGR